MKIMSVCIVALCLTACVSTPRDTEVYRLTSEELAELTVPAVPTLSLDEVIKFSQQKMSADEIITKLKESHSQYELTPSQIINLSRQGVDVKVLDFIQMEREKARLNRLADEINQRERVNQEEKNKLERQLQRSYRYYDPFFDPFYYPYRGNRLFWSPYFFYR